MLIHSTQDLHYCCAVAGYFISYGSVRLSSSISWRLLFMMQASVSFIFAAGSLFLAHSPRWLKHVGRTEEATQAWLKLGFTATEAEKEQEVLQRVQDVGQVQIQESAAAVGVDAKQIVALETARMLWDKDVRGRTVLGIFLMGMQQVRALCRILSCCRAWTHGLLTV